MTEDEAKTKICHRSIDGDGSPARVIANEMFAKRFACVASSCMAWRWINPDSEAPDGYCGLAGRP